MKPMTQVLKVLDPVEVTKALGAERKCSVFLAMVRERDEDVDVELTLHDTSLHLIQSVVVSAMNLILNECDRLCKTADVASTLAPAMARVEAALEALGEKRRLPNWVSRDQ